MLLVLRVKRRFNCIWYLAFWTVEQINFQFVNIGFERWRRNSFQRIQRLRLPSVSIFPTPNQFDQLIFPLLRFNMHVTDFWLSNIVFPHEVKVFEKKLMCMAFWTQSNPNLKRQKHEYHFLMWHCLNIGNTKSFYILMNKIGEKHSRHLTKHSRQILIEHFIWE